MFKVFFSDGRSLVVEATSIAGAEAKAYKLEPVFTIVDTIPLY